MSKREKIILAVMALTLVYGFYALFLETPAPGKPKLAAPENKLDGYNEFITKVAALVKGGVSPEQAYIIEKIPDKWARDPFLVIKTEGSFKPEKEKLTETQKEANESKLDIVYSGFLNMGSRNLAIINGIEYEKGEKLPEGGQIVEQIYPDRVIIGRVGSNRKVTVKLEDTQ